MTLSVHLSGCFKERAKLLNEGSLNKGGGDDTVLYICLDESVHYLFILVDIKVSVIDGSSPFASAYDLENIIGSYRDRNCKLPKA